MDRKTALILGAAAALTAAPALAAPHAERSAVPVAASYAELLTPVPNALERLKASDAEAMAQQPQLIEAQYYQRPVAHHHHHHHHNRRWYMRNGYVWSNGGWILRPRPHHHHHHHHSNY